jgi:PAS domain S-box-containing protein
MSATNGIRGSIARQYSAALREYLEGRGEEALRRAYEAGRRGLAGGMGVLEMTAAHRRALERTLRNTRGSARDFALIQALSCLAESLSPFEMVLRGVRESNSRLRQSLLKLKGVNGKLSAARDAIEGERRRYHVLFDFAPDAYLVTSLDGVIREGNAAAAALLDCAKEALPGKSIADFVSGADHAAFLARLGEFQKDGTGRIDEWHLAIQAPSRPAFPAVLTAALEPDAPHEPSLRWMIRDATERKRLEQKRARSLVDHAKAQAARRFEFLAQASSLLAESIDVEASLIAVARLSISYLAEWCFLSLVEGDAGPRQLEVAHADRRAFELAEQLRRFCLFRSASLGKSADLFTAGKMIDEISPEWCAAAGENPMHAALLRHLCGRSAMIVPLRMHDRLLGLMTFVSRPGRKRYRVPELAIAEDLARRCAMAVENARLYREVIAERDKAEKASRAKDEFLAILSHELRNPLMPVVGWTRVLKNHALIAQDRELSEGVRSMERSAQILARLVEDCLDLARISEGRIRMERKTADLNQIVVGCLESVREMASAKSVHIEHQIALEPAPVEGDAVRLEQVITNLLVNAVKYTHAGGTVTVACNGSGGQARVEVADSGIGIHPAFLEQIFEPFRRGTNSWLTHESGLGLGLAIARRIVQMHGGKIWAESKGLNCGSTFRVILPLVKAESAAPEKNHAAQASALDGKGAKVLLIEDSEDILFLVKMELERMGHSIVTASDGVSGLRQARLHRPDVVISDIKMPGIDGYELIREIRAIPELCGVPAIALTGFGAKNDLDKATAAGFDACISKPAEPEELSALIHSLTAQKHAIKA